MTNEKWLSWIEGILKSLKNDYPHAQVSTEKLREELSKRLKKELMMKFLKLGEYNKGGENDQS